MNSLSNPFLFHLRPWFELQRNLGESAWNAATEASATQVPRGTLYQDETGATWVAQIPGLSASDLELEVEGRVLTLKTKVSAPEGEPTEFEQKLRMNFEVDGDAAQASLVHGLLLVRLPKKASTTAKRIEIAGA
ncbi:MAG TPA: Hsp20/alpha crystallin family protein [Planctomycetota bacterium]|nr:Hsp20/alpha crystallin family protein [Planctomycetota bacterium]